MKSQIIEERKKKLKLNSIQREIIIGKILGDGHLETQNNGRTYRLKVEHSYSQKNYVDWVYRNLNDWVLTPPKIKLKRINGKTVKNYFFQTVSHAAFRYYAQQFYQNKTKIIPKSIHKMLKPRSIAVWFMDDGSLKSINHRALILNTQGFNTQDLINLQKAFQKVYQVVTKFRNQKDGIQLIISEPSATRIYQIIKLYLLPEFNYKLGKIGLTQLPKE